MGLPDDNVEGFRDGSPITFAKQLATLDRISDGRLVFGIGYGWNREEMENHGTAFDSRFRVMVDRCKAMQAIWSEEEATYHGEFTHFDRVWSNPKPVQSPLPVLLGGETIHSLRRVVDFCTGWLPRARGFENPAKEMARLHKVADDAGRDRASIKVTLFGTPADANLLGKCRDAGVHRALIGLPSEGRDAILGKLDDYAKLI